MSSRFTWAMLVAVLLVTLAGCSEPAGGSGKDRASSSSQAFPPGSSVEALAQAGTIRIGYLDGLPGISKVPSGQSTPAGFDVEIATIIAEGLGISPADIEWVPLTVADREPQLINGSVDLLVAAYTITDERQLTVGQAGPYLLTGQQIIVRSGDTRIADVDDLDGMKVCDVPGSTSSARLAKYHAKMTTHESFDDCVEALLDGDLDAVSTDGALLLGFLGEYGDELDLVGEPFTTEGYGIGYQLGDTAMCQYLRETLLAAYADGRWAKAFESTLGIAGVEAPRPPRPAACPA